MTVPSVSDHFSFFSLESGSEGLLRGHFVCNGGLFFYPSNVGNDTKIRLYSLYINHTAS